MLRQVTLCRFCTEPIRHPFRGPDSATTHDHYECGLRAVLGGIGHLVDHQFWCGVLADPDAGLTYRQSALRVADWVEEHGLP